MFTATSCKDHPNPEVPLVEKLVIYCNQAELLAFMKDLTEPSLCKEGEDSIKEAATCSNWPKDVEGLYEIVSVDESCPKGAGVCRPADDIYDTIVIICEYDASGKLLERTVCDFYDEEDHSEEDEPAHRGQAHEGEQVKNEEQAGEEESN
jgi:hypothetical protein